MDTHKIIYQTRIGLLRRRFALTQSGFIWKGIHIPYEEITRFDWGGTKHTLVLLIIPIPVGTKYTILIDTQNKNIKIQLERRSKFLAIVSNLWGILSTHLITMFLVALKAGIRYESAGGIIQDDGVYLCKQGFWSCGAPVYHHGWQDIQIWENDGVFCVGSKIDETLIARFFYIDTPQTQVFATVLKFAQTKKFARLSDFLEL